MNPLTTRQHGLLTRLRDGHGLGVHACHYADDGRHLATCAYDGSVIVWDMDTGMIRRRYEGHTGPVYQVQFSPRGDNERLVTASGDKTARLWHKKTGKLMYTFRDHSGPVCTAAFCHGASRAARARARPLVPARAPPCDSPRQQGARPGRLAVRLTRLAAHTPPTHAPQTGACSRPRASRRPSRCTTWSAWRPRARTRTTCPRT